MKFKCKCGELVACDFKVAYDWVILDSRDFADEDSIKRYLRRDSFYAKCSNCKRVSQIKLFANYEVSCEVNEFYMEETK